MNLATFSHRDPTTWQEGRRVVNTSDATSVRLHSLAADGSGWLIGAAVEVLTWDRIVADGWVSIDDLLAEHAALQEAHDEERRRANAVAADRVPMFRMCGRLAGELLATKPYDTIEEAPVDSPLGEWAAYRAGRPERMFSQSDVLLACLITEWYTRELAAGADDSARQAIDVVLTERCEVLGVDPHIIRRSLPQ